MKSRTLAIIGCFIGAAAIATIVRLNKSASVDSAPQFPVSSQTKSAPPELPVTSTEVPTAAAVAPLPRPAHESVADAGPAPQPPAPPQKPARPARHARANQPNPPAPDEPEEPIARQALSFVGADPAAEAIWYDAINDPTASAHDRQDLIEDLNEDGFADPKNPTVDELPLIENRLALIEQVAPDSMDDVNAAAFAEAYKDLINMHARLAGQ